MKNVIISVTSDLVADARVHKVAQSLHKKGCSVVLVGRKLRNSLVLSQRDYKTCRLQLFFEKGFLFYAEYNVRLFWYLLFKKADILVSNDLDTLLPNYVVSKIKGAELFYDTHEYYTGVPELIERPFVRKFWKLIENYLLPRLKHVYTVNGSIADLYSKEYKIKVDIIRNVPNLQSHEQPIANIEEQKIILYQGAVNKDRGLEEMVEAMMYIENAQLMIIGDGDVFSMLKNRVEELKLKERVNFIGKIPFETLSIYTLKATIGICIEKPTNINYELCLPNKLFDYIHAGVPVLASRLIEIERIVSKYDIGLLLNSHEPSKIAEAINKMLSNEPLVRQWKKNTILAANDLNWEKEEIELYKIYGLN